MKQNPEPATGAPASITGSATRIQASLAGRWPGLDDSQHALLTAALLDDLAGCLEQGENIVAVRFNPDGSVASVRDVADEGSPW